MTDQEVNKIIAEFMGYTVKLNSVIGIDGTNEDLMGISGKLGISHLTRYTQSLDALVPVWEKLHLDHKAIFDEITLDINKLRYGNAAWFTEISYDSCEAHHMATEFKTIQQAAAHATAKAILETNGTSSTD